MALTFSGGPKGTGGHGRGKLVPLPLPDPLPYSQEVGQVAKSTRVGNSCRPSMSGSPGRDLERGQWAELRGQGLDKETRAMWGKAVRGEVQGGTNESEAQWYLSPKTFLPPSVVSTGSQWVQGEGPWLLVQDTRM